MTLAVRAAIFTIVVPGMVAGVVPLLIGMFAGAALGSTAFLVAGGIVVACGAAIYAWCVHDFITRGHGTPNPYDAPSALVVRGLYNIVRNPMYLGVGAVIIGHALLFQSIAIGVYAAAVFCAFHLRVVMYEEPTLARAFGASWDEYRARVSRWLPRLARD